VVISSAFAHFGEEGALVGVCGSGTIFLAGCSLRCLFCQNFDISIGLDGAVHRFFPEPTKMDF
jgi:putative pyruvate formate lyase activating enzyme